MTSRFALQTHSFQVIFESVLFIFCFNFGMLLTVHNCQLVVTISGYDMTVAPGSFITISRTRSTGITIQLPTVHCADHAHLPYWWHVNPTMFRVFHERGRHGVYCIVNTTLGQYYPCVICGRRSTIWLSRSC